MESVQSENGAVKSDNQTGGVCLKIWSDKDKADGGYLMIRSCCLSTSDSLKCLLLADLSAVV